MTNLWNQPTLLLTFAGFACLPLVSCATGPTYSEVKANLPAIENNKGRVFVYRPKSFAGSGAAVRPKVKIDDQIIGTSESGGFLYSDQQPGMRTVSLTTETTLKTDVEVEAGKASFVECSLGLGLFVGRIKPIQVTAATGETNIGSCKLSQ